MLEKSERRSAIRRTFGDVVDFELIRWESGHWERIQAKGQAVDISSKGIGLVTTLPLKGGEILRLDLPLQAPDTVVPVFSEVRWAQQEKDRSRAGLQFLT